MGNPYGKGFEGPDPNAPQYRDAAGNTSSGGVIYGPDGQPIGRSQAGYQALVAGQPVQLYDQGDEWSMAQSLQDLGSDNSRDFYYRGDPEREARDVARARAFGETMQRRPGAQADLSQANAMRAQQMGLSGDLQAATEGRGPSLADIQMNRGMSQAGLASAQGAATPGVNMAGAQRSALMGAAGMGSQVAAGAAGTRAGEITSARGELGALQGGMRGADAGAAMSQAELDLRQRRANDAMTLGYERLGMDTLGLGMQGRQEQGGARRTWQNMAMAQGLRDQAEIDRKNRERVNTGLAIGSALMSGGGLIPGTKGVGQAIAETNK